MKPPQFDPAWPPEAVSRSVRTLLVGSSAAGWGAGTEASGIDSYRSRHFDYAARPQLIEL